MAVLADDSDIIGGYGSRSGRPAALVRWLVLVATLIVLIVVVGGITRLTESGLSITQWKPLTGAIPPLTQADWQAEFDAYKRIPEYIEINGPAGMTLAEYRFIYFWEWAHRLLARLIGLAFALPLAWFWLRRAIPRGYKVRLLTLLALGGLQGLFGWLMVRSGLSHSTDVSHFWLSIHLMTALVTLAAIVWTICDLNRLARNPRTRPARMTGLAMATGAVLFVQLLLGAWVAGLNAGLASDSWPLMQGRVIPEVNWQNGAFWAFTHDPFLIHFLHRWWGWVLVAVLVVLARRIKRIGHHMTSVAIHCAFGTQILLGIATVLSGVALWLAVLHQLVGALLVVATVWGMHCAGRRT